MAGSLREVGDGVWELRVYLGRDVNGRVRHRHTRVRGTKRVAKRALEDLLAEVRAAPEPSADDKREWGRQTTLNDAFSAWKQNGWQDLSPSTVRRYESIWSVHVADTIGSRPIAKLGSYELETYFRRLKAAGLAEATVRQTRAVLNRTCKLARRWSGGVLPNPVADTELPSWGLEDRQDVRAPEASEVQRLLTAAGEEDVRFAGFLRLVTATGMRRGEACALRWSDVDFETAVVTVDESVVAAAGGAVVKAPKTRASIRQLSVDAGTLTLLRRLQAEQWAVAEACDQTVDESAFVFSFAAGGASPPYPDVMSHAFDRVRRKAGVASDVHLHSLRHFQATAIDAVVSERQKQARLGWATVHMARHYTDAVGEEDRKASDHVGRLLDGGHAPHLGQEPDGTGAAS
jgi:integrase